jgi:hypothetical protein
MGLKVHERWRVEGGAELPERELAERCKGQSHAARGRIRALNACKRQSFADGAI